MSGNFLSCLEGVKDPFEAQEGRWEESLIAGSGPGTKPGLTTLIFHTVVRVHPMLGILCDSLGSFLSPYTHIKMLTMGNLPFSHSSSTGLSLQPDSTSKSCPYSSGATGPGPRDLLRGDRDLRLPLPKTRARWVPASTLGISDLCACRTPTPSADVPPSQREQPPPPAPVPARALAGEPESWDESPPLQGEPALSPAPNPDAHDD